MKLELATCDGLIRDLPCRKQTTDNDFSDGLLVFVYETVTIFALKIGDGRRRKRGGVK